MPALQCCELVESGRGKDCKGIYNGIQDANPQW